MLASFICMQAQKTMSTQEISDRLQIRELVDRYSIESDKGNQDYYRNIFVKNLKLRIFSQGQVNEVNGVDEMIRLYKIGGKAKISHHLTGQQTVEFSDANHATGTVYLNALLVNDADQPTYMYLKYYDKYEKIDGRWWITERDQHIEYAHH